MNNLDAEMSKVFEANGVIFAFSQKQFDEQKAPETKYVRMGSGDLCPKDNVEKYINELSTVIESNVIRDFNENGAREIIKREYFNYECQISNDTSDMKDAISGYIEKYPNEFTDKFIKEVCGECFNLAVENNWF